MRALLLVIVLAAGCASAPGPKRPDESRRVPVNRTFPAELAGGATGEQGHRAPEPGRRNGRVAWR